MTALEKWKNDFKEFISELSIPRDDYKGIMAYIDEVPNEALEQQPCEDAISRKAVLNGLASIAKVKARSDAQKSLMGRIMFFVEQLPPVTPKEKTGWIPVSERLPEPYKEVIVTDIETSDTYLSRYIGNGYWECDNGLFKNRIIAWMPLPEPYKAESEKV